jgi:hypothetical protein
MFYSKIAHIGDIHIKNRYIDFSNLIESLHEEKPDVIVLVGDIIDSITNITPNIILDIISFLSSLISIAPTIMIPGNHDISCKINDADFFTTITKNHDLLKPPKFNYWRHSGIYKCNDILWTVIAPDEDIPNIDISINPQILLFHETLQRIDVNTFSYYDAIMAGHIHIRQTISENGAYCGSLFQQSIKESHNNHGYILWEIIDHSATLKFIDIKNNFGYLKVEIEGDVDVTELPIPDKVIYYDIYYTDELSDIIIKKYESKYGKPRYVKNKNKNITNIDNISHYNLIKDYLEKNGEVQYLDEILLLHKKYYTEPEGLYTGCTNQKIRLLSLEFENLYNFNSYNRIDFTKMEHKLSGIIANNNMGKTSLIDIILYGLYNVHPRTSTKQCILNKDSTYCTLSIEFEIGYKRGLIKKSMISSLNNKTNSSLCKFYFDDVDLTQNTIIQTLQEIKKVVGIYNDSIISSIQLQYMFTNFVNMTPFNRRKKLSELLSLKEFEQIEAQVVKDINELQNKCHSINIYDTEVDDNKINEIQNNIINASREYHKPVENLRINKYIVTSIINEFNQLIENNIFDDEKKYNKIVEIIENIDKRINEFKSENIKIAVIEKYNQYGISYLYKLYQSDKNEITSQASVIANLILEKDHHLRWKENLCIKMNITNKVNNLKLILNQLEEQIKIASENEGIDENIIRLNDELLCEYKKIVCKEIEINKQNELYDIYNQLEVLKIYRQIIKPTNGIISIHINNMRKSIEDKINEWLSICFINNSEKIQVKIEYDYEILYSCNNEYWLDISLSSGYQKFILNIIFRIVLWQISNVLLPDALIIDEGFGMCDKNNIEIITNLLLYISKNKDCPKLIFIVSHIDYLNNSIEFPLHIENGSIIEHSLVKFIKEDDKIINNDYIELPCSNSINYLIPLHNEEFTTSLSPDSCNTLSTINESIDFSIISQSTSDLNLHILQDDKFYCKKCDMHIKNINKEKHLISKKHKA